MEFTGIGGTTMAAQVAVGIPGSEEKQIRAGQRGDHQAVETLFRRYQRPLFQTALRVLGNTEDAEDALQDGLLSAYRNLKRFEGRSQFSTWLTRIVINAALMRRRPRNRFSRTRKFARCSAKTSTSFHRFCGPRSCFARFRAIPQARRRRN